MKRTVLVWILCAACGGEQVTESADVGASLDASNHDAFDSTLPDPPRNLAPCAATSCRDASLGGPPCGTSTHDDDFGVGEFGVHAYRSMVWDGAVTKIRVDATAGEWTPIIVLARLNGEVLFDGDVGAVRAPFDVHANTPADLAVTTAQATGIVVYVTSTEALDSDFATPLPADAAYTVTIDSDCGGDRTRCFVNDRDTGEPECAWLHYIGKHIVPRLEGTVDQQIAAAATAAWWSLKQGRLASDNPIGPARCAEVELEPLETCDDPEWRVGLADVRVAGHGTAELEELAVRLYDGAMISGVLRTTANEAGLDREDAAAVMQASDTLLAAWLLRNSAIGFTVQAADVDRDCIVGDAVGCFGGGSEASRYYARDRDTAFRSIADLQELFDTLGQ